MSQSHIRAVESPLPVQSRDEDEGEKDEARMASPCPGMADEHLDTARTRKTACGVYWREMDSSVLFRPGFKIE